MLDVVDKFCRLFEGLGFFYCRNLPCEFLCLNAFKNSRRRLGRLTFCLETWFNDLLAYFRSFLFVNFSVLYVNFL